MCQAYSEAPSLPRNHAEGRGHLAGEESGMLTEWEETEEPTPVSRTAPTWGAGELEQPGAMGCPTPSPEQVCLFW